MIKKNNAKIIYIESNGAKAVYIMHDGSIEIDNIFRQPFLMDEISKEIKSFYKYFWSNGEESWKGCDQNYLDFFNPDGFLYPVDQNDNPLIYNQYSESASS